MSIDRLIHPYSQDEFFEDVWERQPLHIARKNPEYFADLLEDLPTEEIIWQTCHSWGEVSLARANTNYGTVDYAERPPSIATIRRAFKNDYTVVINTLERKRLRIAQLCRDVEKDCCFNANVNLYITGPESQGLDYHYDDQDGFILQLEGSKTWRIYDRRADLPLDDGRYQHLDCSGSGCVEYEVSPGDVLYIPRGFIHEARARNNVSMHLTLSVSVVRWASLWQELIQVIAENERSLRRAVPINLVKTGRLCLVDAARQLLVSKLEDERYLAGAVSRLQDRLLGAKLRLPAGRGLHVKAVEGIGLESQIEIAADQVYVLSAAGDGLILKCIGASVEIAENLKEAVEFLCRRERFLVHELPGSLTEAEKIALVERLIECEFLTSKT